MKIFKSCARINVLLFLFCIGMYGSMLAKKVEPYLFPVVTEFSIDQVSFSDNKLYMSGLLYRNRSCSFKSIVAYDDSTVTRKILRVDNQRTEHMQVGWNAWGPWVIRPQTKNLTILAIHECVTGLVETQVFKGVL